MQSPVHYKMNTNMNMKRILTVTLVTASIFAITACVKNPATGKRQFMLISEKQEIAMGAEYDPQLVEAMGLYENPQLQALVENIVREMGLISHRPHLKYHIRLLDSPVVNAFAVPGGYIYLTRGILAHFNNQAELAGVIGHEMGHITARHTVSKMSSQTLAQLALIGGMVVSETFRNYGELAMMGMQLLFLKYSRDDEREADRLGVEYTAKMRYDAGKFADFYKLLQRMQLASEHGGIPTFLSTHPDPGNRFNDVKKDALKWQQELSHNEWKVNTNEYLSMIDGIIFGDDPRQGYVDGNTFYHPTMKFQFNFPQGWKLINSPTSVQIAEPEQKAILLLMHAPGSTLLEASAKMLEDLKLQVISRDATQVNGFNSLVVISQLAQSDPTKNQRVRTNFMDIGGTFLAFHAVSLEGDFTNYTPNFISTQNGFRPLTDPARINVKPNILRVRKINSSGTLSNALRALNVPAGMYQEIALLNNLGLNDMIQPGQYIKVIEKQ